MRGFCAAWVSRGRRALPRPTGFASHSSLSYLSPADKKGKLSRKKRPEGEGIKNLQGLLSEMVGFLHFGMGVTTEVSQ